jgi:hypothetical protein
MGDEAAEAASRRRTSTRRRWLSWEMSSGATEAVAVAVAAAVEA